MFYYLSGTVAAIEPGMAVIDCQGVGYACNTSMRSLSMLKAGEKAKMFTYCYIREDAFDIYGFATQRELNSFKLLIGISGVWALRLRFLYFPPAHLRSWPCTLLRATRRPSRLPGYR